VGRSTRGRDHARVVRILLELLFDIHFLWHRIQERLQVEVYDGTLFGK
jgi:hypothetical protein